MQVRNNPESSLRFLPVQQGAAVRPAAKPGEWHSAFTKGCSNCWRRRVKCDGTKPACIRCLKAHRKCGGYHDEARAAGAGPGMEKCNIRKKREYLPVQPASIVAPCDAKSSWFDAELFHYFRTNIVSQLAGTVDQDFWSLHTLQIIHQQPVVWHACNAVAAIHRSHRDRIRGSAVPDERNQKLRVHALQQYHASLQKLISMTQRKDLSEHDKEAILLANTLFLIMAWIRHDIPECLKHHENNRDLIHRWKVWRGTRFHDISLHLDAMRPFESLIIINQRFEYMLLTMRGPNWTSKHFTSDLKYSARIGPFDSVNEAHFELEPLWDLLRQLALDTHSPLPTEPRRAMVRHLMGMRWDKIKRKLQAFAESKTLSRDEQSIIGVMKARLAMGYIFLLKDFDEPETRWDDFNPAFERIVVGAQQHLKHQYPTVREDMTSDSPTRQSRSFYIAPGINEILYLVAWLCRDRIIRRKAVNLLDLDFRLSGAVDTSIYTSMAKTIISLEEAAWTDPTCGARYPATDCSCDRRRLVCASHRIVHTALLHISEGVADLLAYTTADILYHGPPQQARFHYGEE